MILVWTDPLQLSIRITIFYIAILAVTFSGVTPSLCAPDDNLMHEPTDPLVATAKSFVAPTDDNITCDPLAVQLKQLFYIYRNILGPTKGQRCPMSPTCSAFGKSAIKQHGFFLGLVMTCDRLHRCGHDLQFYRYQMTNEGVFFEDDPE